MCFAHDSNKYINDLSLPLSQSMRLVLSSLPCPAEEGSSFGKSMASSQEVNKTFSKPIMLGPQTQKVLLYTSIEILFSINVSIQEGQVQILSSDIAH